MYSRRHCDVQGLLCIPVINITASERASDSSRVVMCISRRARDIAVEVDNHHVVTYFTRHPPTVCLWGSTDN